MSKYKASTRLTEINAEQIEQLRREYNQLSVSKFSLSEAFKQYALQNRSYVVIAKNGNFEEFSRYNQILANLCTNLSQFKSADPEINRRINNTLRNLIKMKLDVSRLRFKTLEIKTSTKPDFAAIINSSLFDDSNSERKKQYTISFTKKECSEYKEKFPKQDFYNLLRNFFVEFSVYEKEFTNPSINLALDNNLVKCGEAANAYVVEKKHSEAIIKNILDYLQGAFSEKIHPNIIKGSADLIAFIDGAK